MAVPVLTHNVFHLEKNYFLFMFIKKYLETMTKLAATLISTLWFLNTISYLHNLGSLEKWINPGSEARYV
jgi:hypothetical protein